MAILIFWNNRLNEFFRDTKLPGRPKCTCKYHFVRNFCPKFWQFFVRSFLSKILISAVYRGSNHSASSCKPSRRSKIDKLAEIASPSSIQRAASRIDLQMTPIGLPTKVKKVTKELFSAESCLSLQQDLDLSNSQTKILLQGIRLGCGSRLSAMTCPV